MSPKKEGMAAPRAAGRLIAVDGSSGADVRKHAAALCRQLQKRKTPVGISWWDASGLFFEMGLAKRKHRVASPRTLMLLYASDLLFRLRWEIRPALAAGQHVIAAPYLQTAFAFGRANGLTLSWLTALFRFAPSPDESLRAPERKKSVRWKRDRQEGLAEFSSEVLAAALPSFQPMKVRRAMIALLDAQQPASSRSRHQTVDDGRRRARR